MKSYWCLSEDEQFDWAFDMYQQVVHSADMINQGKATKSFIQKKLSQKVVEVKLTHIEAQLILKNMHKSLDFIKNMRKGAIPG